MPDSAIPVYQTINQSGQATAEIEAVIKALGLKLPTGFNTEPATNPKSLIQWDGGETPESLEDYIIGTGRGTSGAELFLAGQSNEGLEPASLGLKGYGNGLPAGAGKITAAVAGVIRTIITSGEASSFLQILGTATRWRCNFGRIAVVWPALGSSAIFNVSHGLGNKPTIFLAFQGFPNPGAWLVAMNSAEPTSTTVQMFVRTAENSNLAAGLEFSFYWLAIG